MIAVVGRGYIGTMLAERLPGAMSMAVDIADPVAVGDALDRIQPRTVVNAAGKTGTPNVDWCEQHPFETYRSNVIGPIVLANECAKRRVHLIHLGSGCIFYGKSAHPDGQWRENDFANPAAVYTRSKYAADLALKSLPDVAIVRLRMPLGGVPHPRNLIDKLVKYAEVTNVANSITVVEDLIDVVRQIAESRGAGIYHATNPGAVWHSDILALYRKLVDETRRAPTFITPDALMATGRVRAERSNCVLADTRGLRMPSSLESIRRAMISYAQSARGAV